MLRPGSLSVGDWLTFDFWIWRAATLAVPGIVCEGLGVALDSGTLVETGSGASAPGVGGWGATSLFAWG